MFEVEGAKKTMRGKTAELFARAAVKARLMENEMNVAMAGGPHFAKQGAAGAASAAKPTKEELLGPAQEPKSVGSYLRVMTDIAWTLFAENDPITERAFNVLHQTVEQTVGTHPLTIRADLARGSLIAMPKTDSRRNRTGEAILAMSKAGTALAKLFPALDEHAPGVARDLADGVLAAFVELVCHEVDYDQPARALTLEAVLELKEDMTTALSWEHIRRYELNRGLACDPQVVAATKTVIDALSGLGRATMDAENISLEVEDVRSRWEDMRREWMRKLAKAKDIAATGTAPSRHRARQVALHEAARMTQVHKALGDRGMILEFVEVDMELVGMVLYGADKDPMPMSDLYTFSLGRIEDVQALVRAALVAIEAEGSAAQLHCLQSSLPPQLRARAPPTFEAAARDQSRSTRALAALAERLFTPPAPALERAAFHCNRLSGQPIRDLFIAVDGPIAQIPWGLLPLEGVTPLQSARISVIRSGRDLCRHPRSRIAPITDRPADLNAPQNEFGHACREWTFPGMLDPICPDGAAPASRSSVMTADRSRAHPPARITTLPKFAIEYVPFGGAGGLERVELDEIPVTDLLILSKPLTWTSAPAAEVFLVLLPWLLEAARCVLVSLWAVPDWASHGFLQKFHERLAAGALPHAAWEDARDLFAATHPRWVWATWQLCGDTRVKPVTSLAFPLKPAYVVGGVGRQGTGSHDPR